MSAIKYGLSLLSKNNLMHCCKIVSGRPLLQPELFHSKYEIMPGSTHTLSHIRKYHAMPGYNFLSSTPSPSKIYSNSSVYYIRFDKLIFLTFYDICLLNIYFLLITVIDIKYL